MSHSRRARRAVTISVKTAAAAASFWLFAGASSEQTKYFREQYPPQGKWPTVTVAYKGENYTFQVQTAKDRPRIAVAASEQTAERAARGVRSLAFGLLGRDLDLAPFRQAALTHLAQSRRGACDLRIGGQITPTLAEWSFQCSK